MNTSSGSYELLAGGSIGRFASLAAALVTADIGVVGVGVVTLPALIVAGLWVSGSLAFGLAWAVSGLAFAGVGAVAARLTASARAARGLAVIALAVAYLLRAAGDFMGGQEPAWPELAVPDWLGPTNPAVRRRPLGVSLPLIAFEVVMAALAIVLTPASRPRAGLLPQRRGPAEAPALLAGPFGLAWRLQRAAFLGWPRSSCSA
jgi:ABC-2 type transport system permease protein